MEPGGLLARIERGVDGEEFPRFTDFWIERPAANAKELTIYALLNSRRATGAYRFVIKPGSDTAVDVKAQVYMRENVSKLAIAPLTSMFFFGRTNRRLRWISAPRCTTPTACRCCPARANGSGVR